MELEILLVTASLLAIGSWTDLRTMRIPNRLTAGFAIGGFLFHTIWTGWSGLLESLAGAIAGALPFVLLYRFGGIGAGDIKWFAAYGAWAGPVSALRLMVDSVLVAGGFSLLLLSLRMPGIRRIGGKLPWPWGKHPSLPGRGAVFPFMLAVLPAYAGIWMGGADWI